MSYPAHKGRLGEPYPFHRIQDGVLKPLEPVELREGEEVFARLERYEDRVRRLRKYRGMLGKASEEEIEELLLEAEFGRL